MRCGLFLLILLIAGVAASVRGEEGAFAAEVRTVVDRAGTVAFSPDGRRIAVGHPDGATTVWETRSGKKVRTLNRPAPVIRSVAWSPDGRLLAAAGGGDTVTIWDTQTWERLKTLKGHTEIVHSIAFSPDSHTLASGSSDKTVQLWDIASGKAVQTLAQPVPEAGYRRSAGVPGMVFAIAFSPDGSTLASGGGDGVGHSGELVLWDIPSGQLRERLLAPGEPQVWTLDFSPDGELLISGAVDGTVTIYDAAAGKVLGQLEGGGPLRSIAISPDGRILAAGIRDLIRLWDWRTEELLQTLDGHANFVGSLDFSADGGRLLSGGSSEVKLWELARPEARTAPPTQDSR